MYLDFPSVPGESQSPNGNWNNKIEVQHWTYDVSLDHSMEASTGVVASGSRVGYMHITTVMGKHTPLLFALLAKGETTPDVYLRVSQPGPNGPYEAETYHLQWVVVSHYSTSGHPGSSNLPQEHWQLAFIAMTETYQDVKDGQIQPAITNGFDFGKGVVTQ
ncbi:MAG TPA: type VI secretion system tube protein Hcp [Bryobacteraceae bacterium]|nr:type VI secretion system tube protein Hcp [Bryobacteraceae bacterium]